MRKIEFFLQDLMLNVKSEGLYLAWMDTYIHPSKSSTTCLWANFQNLFNLSNLNFLNLREKNEDNV